MKSQLRFCKAEDPGLDETCESICGFLDKYVLNSRHYSVYGELLIVK